MLAKNSVFFTFIAALQGFQAAASSQPNTGCILRRNMCIRMGKTIDITDAKSFQGFDNLLLRDCRIKQGHSNMSELTDLTCLRIEECEGAEHIYGAQLPPNLRQLIITQCELSEFPRTILDLPVLNKLDLSNNCLEALPDELGDMAALTNVDLSNNQIDIVPNALLELKNLAILDLSSNMIRAIPEEISSLKNLEHLCLNNNQLNCLPLGMSQLHKLRILYILQGNTLDYFEGIPGLNNLIIK